MTHRYSDHAREVADQFARMLDSETGEKVKESHLEELVLLIDSAISSCVLDEKMVIADKVEKLAHELRHDAEFFEITDKAGE
jgi:hypothetical protein